MTPDDPIFPLDATFLRQKSIHGAIVTSGAQLINFCLLLTSQILLARLLIPSDFGIIAMVAPILGFLTVMADLGIGQAIVQRPILTRELLNSAFWLNNLLSFAMMVLLMMTAPFLARLYHEPRIVLVTIALASLVGVTGLSVQQMALLNRTMRFSTLAISETLSQGAGLCISAFAAWRGFGYWSLVMGQATTVVVTFFVVWSASSWRPSWPSFKSDAFPMLRFGGTITISNIALYLNTVLDNVLIGYFLGATLLGIYDRAWKLVVLPLNQIMAPINRVAIPALSRLADNPGRFQNAFGQMFQLLMFVSLPGLAIGVVVAQPLIHIVFGQRWEAVAPVFSWLCLGSMLTPINMVTFWIFVSLGRPRDQMIFGTAAAIINIISYAVGVHWGIIGVTRTSTIVAYVWNTPMLVWAAARKGPINLRYFAGAILPFIASTIAAMGTLQVYAALFHVTGIGDLFAITLIAYGATVPVLACFSSGRATLKSAARIRYLVFRGS